MQRRDFLLGGLAAGAATMASPSTAAQEAGAKRQFKLRYGPHFGMFRHSAGDDLLDQLRFMADQGFTAFEDNGEVDLGWSVSGDATDGQWTVASTPVGGGDRGDPPADGDASVAPADPASDATSAPAEPVDVSGFGGILGEEEEIPGLSQASIQALTA